jgi:stress response protein YsnF
MPKPVIDSVEPTARESAPVIEESPRAKTEEVSPLVEEVATISKQEHVTGRVRVRTVTDTVEEAVEATLQEESVEVTRVPVDRFVDVAPQVRTEGDVTILPVMEEVLVVEKRLVLKEELHIRRRPTTKRVEVPVTLRRQRAVVERFDTEENATEE